MTDVDELVKRLRRLDYKTDLDEAAADTLERQAKWLEGFVKQSDEMAMALSSEATKSDHLFSENSKLHTRIAELEADIEAKSMFIMDYGYWNDWLANKEKYAARAALNGEKE